MTVATEIESANAVLPGLPVMEGKDPRWQAIIRVGEFVESEPESVWSFVEQWGSHDQEDLRDAIATCLLEHLLEYHFEDYFPRAETRSLSDPLFADTFLRCWKFGKSTDPANAARFDELTERLTRKA